MTSAPVGSHTHIHKKIPSIQFCCACFQSGLRGELRAEEEKLKEKDQERRDLEEMVDVLRTELNKTEQARKDASIKVRPPSPHQRQTNPDGHNVTVSWVHLCPVGGSVTVKVCPCPVSPGVVSGAAEESAGDEAETEGGRAEQTLSNDLYDPQPQQRQDEE